MTPGAVIRAKAEAFMAEHPDNELGFAVDYESYADLVLVGLATKQQSLVVTVAKSEWTLANSLALAKSFGYPDQKPNAYAQAMKAKR